MDERTLALKSSLLVTAMRPTGPPSDASTPSHRDCDRVNKEADGTAAAIRSGFRQTPWFSWRYGQVRDRRSERSRVLLRRSGAPGLDPGVDENSGVGAALLFDHEAHVAGRGDR